LAKALTNKLASMTSSPVETGEGFIKKYIIIRKRNTFL
jgi:hypothetical protein